MVSGQSEHVPSVVGLPQPAEALIDALKQQKQSCCWYSLERRTQSPSSSQLEQGFTECNIKVLNLMEEIKRKPDQVFWIGEPSSSPLAVIHGPTGTFVVTKSNIIIGRDTTDSDIDLTSQEANFHSSSYMVLSYTGHPNRWGVQLNGNIGVIINKKLYQPTTVPQYFPFSCVFRFPPSSDNYFFRAIELAPHCDGITRNINPETTRLSCNISAKHESACLKQADHCNLEESKLSSPSLSEEVNAPESGQKAELLSVEEVKEEASKNSAKPPYSYAQLIAQAIMSTPDKQITLSGIYSFIIQKYPWYQTCDRGWQNSIRHNLSLSRYFIKMARTQNEPGKGSFWKMDPDTAQQSMEAAYEKKKPKNLKSCKSLNSPVSDLEDFVSEGHTGPPTSDNEKASDEDCFELLDNQAIAVDKVTTTSVNKSATRTMVTARELDAATAAADVTAKGLPKFEDENGRSNSQFHELEGVSADVSCLTDLERCADWPMTTRTAQSAPCSPKGVLSRREQNNGGTTFRVRQSAKDGRSLLQICHSPPEYRSVGNSHASEAICRKQILYQLRGGTKSLSTTPVRELLQGSSGLRFEDLKRDFPNLRQQSSVNEKSANQIVGKADDTIATTSAFSRSQLEPCSPSWMITQEQRINSSCNKSKMSIYGKHSEHAEKMSLDEVCEEIKGTAIENFETHPSRVIRKYGMDGTIRSDAEKSLNASKRLADGYGSSEDRTVLLRAGLKRKHDDDVAHEESKRCHSLEAEKMPPSVLDKDLAISKGLHPVSLMKTPVDLVRNNGDNQIIHTSEASSTSQIYTPFIQEIAKNHPLQQVVSSGSTPLSSLKGCNKQSSLDTDCIAKPIPLTPSGPAVKQFLNGSKIESGLNVNKADLAKRYEDCLLYPPVGICRETAIGERLPYTRISASPAVDTHNSNLCGQVVQSSFQFNPTVHVPANLANNFTSGLQTSLSSGIRSSLPHLQRGVLAPSGLSNNSIQPNVFAPKPCIPVNIQNESLSSKSLSTTPVAGKVFPSMISDITYPLQTVSRTQPTLNFGQSQNNLNLEISSVLNGSQIPSTLSVPTAVDQTASAISSATYSTVNDCNVIDGISNLLQGLKQSNESSNGLSADQLVSQLALTRFLAEKCAVEKLQQQQQQQQQSQQQAQIVAALQTLTQQQTEQESLTNPILSNALLSQCINLQLLQQLKTPTTCTNLNTLMFPNNNPVTLLTTQNTYIPATSRSDIIANGVVNNGTCELLGIPAVSANTLLDAQNVTSI